MRLHSATISEVLYEVVAPSMLESMWPYERLLYRPLI